MTKYLNGIKYQMDDYQMCCKVPIEIKNSFKKHYLVSTNWKTETCEDK